MNITIQDVPSVYSNRTQRLSKSSIDLATVPYAILVLRNRILAIALAYSFSSCCSSGLISTSY